MNPGVVRLVTCGGRPFPTSAFEAPADAEQGDDAASAALRRSLEEPVEPAITPLEGWRVLRRAERQVVFGAGEPPDIITLTVELEDDVWSWAGQGQCTVRLWRKGAASADWDVDPERSPSPEDRVLHLLLSERACTSGADPRPRLEEPQVSYGESVVTIALFVRHLGPPGVFHTCIGFPAVPIEVELEEPLRDRRLLNGGIYPPQTPEVPF